LSIESNFTFVIKNRIIFGANIREKVVGCELCVVGCERCVVGG